MSSTGQLWLNQSQYGISGISICTQREEFQKCCDAISAFKRIDVLCHVTTNPEDECRKTQFKYLVAKKKKVEPRYFSLIKGGICSAKAFGYR